MFDVILLTSVLSERRHIGFFLCSSPRHAIIWPAPCVDLCYSYLLAHFLVNMRGRVCSAW